MAQRELWWLLIPRPLRELPADLAAVLVTVLLATGAVFLPVVDETPLRVVLGLPMMLFVPGYAFVAALFPEAGDGLGGGDSDSAADAPRSGIDGLERVALSFGTSIAVVPLVGLVLNFTPWGIRLTPIVLSLDGFTLAVTAVAVRRRRELPSAERFRVPYDQWGETARAELLDPDTRTDAALNVLLAVSLLLAATSVGYAVAVPKQGESFSEFYLLTEQENGTLVADDYPTNFTRGEGNPLIVGIENREHETVDYRVVVQLQRVSMQNNSTRVLGRESLHRFDTTLEHNETWNHEHRVTPTMSGDRLRLTYLLYRGTVPDSPTTANAYREVHLWVTVEGE